MYISPRDVNRRALQLVTQLAPARDNPDVAPALRTAIELAIDAELEFDAVAEASAIPVAEIAAIAAERMAAHHEVLEQGIAERGKSLRVERHRLGWRIRTACELGMSITTAADAAGVTVEEATTLIEESPIFPSADPDNSPIR